MAKDLGVVLSTINSCLLTPVGVAEKSKLTAEFLRRKV
jgi:hypothetical protein